MGVQFVDVAKEAGLNVETIFGGEHRNKYLLETTGCGAAFFDYDQDDWLDIFLVNGWRLEGFPKGQEPVCHLFKNNRDGTFTDVTLKSGLARSGWGQACCVGDYNNDGWLDILVANGHVYPEVDGTQVDAAYAEHKYLYRNLRNGQFEDLSRIGGSGITTAAKARGFAVGDFDNDGDLDAVVNCVNAPPQLLRCDSTLNRSWVKIRVVGTKSNRTGIGARLKVVAQTGTPVLTAKPGTPLTQIEEVHSCNGYFSASDLRIHFGLGDAKKVDLVEIRWPSGQVDTLQDLDVNRLYVVEEGGKILKTDAFTASTKKA